MIFSILIPTINNAPYLELCISYIEKHTSLDYEILIFNNGGDECNTSYIKSLPHRSLHSRYNCGVSYAYNALAREARGDYFLLWDDDKLILPNWDVEILPLLKSEGTYSWKSLVEIWPHASNPCSITQDYGRSPDDFREERLLEEFKSIRYPRKVSLAVSQVMSKELFHVLNGYDEGFYPGFGSDPDIMWRAFSFLGGDSSKFTNANRSFYYHFTSATTNRVFRFKILTYGLRAWGWVLFYLRHGFSVSKLRSKVGHGTMVGDESL